MPPVRRIRWMTLGFPLCLFILLADGLCAGLAHGQLPHKTTLETKNILILHAFEANVPVFVGTDKGLSTTLESGGVSGLNQFFESLDLRRNPSSEYRKLLIEQMRLRYGRRKLDMIVTMFPEALEFVLKDGRDIFPDVPILALYLPEGFELPKANRRIIGHSAKTDIIGTFEIALKLVPGAKRVYVVSGIHEVDKMIEDRARRELNKWETRLEFHYLSQMSFEDMLAAISTAPPDSIILALVLSQDITGTSFTSVKVAQRLSQVSKAPIFGLLDAALGYGIAGGSLINFERIGTRAGELVVDILRGSPTAQNMTTFLDVPPVPMFDWRQLKRWNLSEAALPTGSIVENRKVTLWDFKYYIIAALTFILAQSLLIFRLTVQKRRRRSAEASLRQRTKELDQFFSVNLDLLCIANTEGFFLRLNPAWEKTLGYSIEEFMARQFFDFVHPDDLAATREAVSKLALQREVVYFKNRYCCKDGTYRWLEWTSAPAGELIYAAARDITERLMAEAEAGQRREELAHVARIATMGELTASLAHEINQPLGAIRSNAEAAQRFLSRVEPDISEVRQILNDIIRDDRRADDVVQKVMGLVRKEKPLREPLDLNKVIQEVVALVRGESVLKGLSITMELSPNLKMIQGDRTQLQQVILNLILNGAAAMRNSLRAQRKIIVRTAMPDNGTVKASVTDFGIGVDENNIQRLFEPFYTTRPEGLGVGLSISQRIITAHGGILKAANNPQGGATFGFTLPAHQGDAR
jgi:PAS domain S-box-containing protein